MLTPDFKVDFYEFKIKEKITQALRNHIQNGLLVGATIIEDAAKQLAPKHVGAFIKHTPVTKTGENSYQVSVYVPIADAPDAGAWEYGSGTHRTRGKADFYKIEGHPLLAFDWKRMGTHFVGHFVTHPGIHARPYLHPALYASLDRIRVEISKLNP